MGRIPITPPMGGLSTDSSVSDQPPGTSRELDNVLPIDATNGRRRIATRPGLGDLLSGDTLSNAKAVRALVTSITKAKRTTYAELANDAFGLEWSKSGVGREACRGVKVDSEGNQYWLAGQDQVVKRNADGKEVWTLPIPTKSASQVVRAFDVTDLGFVYIGVSEGGSQDDAKLWCFQPVTIGEAPELLWDLEPGGFVMDCVEREGRLYTVQDFPDAGRSVLVIYHSARTVNPVLEVFNPQLPYPSSGIAVGPDGSSYIASRPNNKRGIDPRYPTLSPRRADWQLTDLDQYQDRVWAHFKASDPAPGQTFRHGDSVPEWRDLSGNLRHLIQAPGKDAPIFNEFSVGDSPGIRFNPDTTGTLLGSAMQSYPNESSVSSLHREQLRTILPSNAGARYAAFFLVRVRNPADAVIGALVGQPVNGATADCMLRFNTKDGGPPVARSGSVMWEQQGGNGTGGGGGGWWDTNPGVYNDITGGAPGDDTTGIVLVTMLYDIDGSKTCEFRVNGRPHDRFTTSWTADSGITSLTEFGFTTISSSNGLGFDGDVLEVLVLSDYVSDNGVNEGTQQLITTPGYPDSAWDKTSDTEVERIEGMMMWEYGLQHYLDDGTYAADSTADTRGDLSANANTGAFVTGTPFPHPFHLRRRFSFVGATFATPALTLTLAGAFKDYRITLAVDQSSGTPYVDSLILTDGTAVVKAPYSVVSRTSDDVLVLGSEIAGGSAPTDVEGAFTGFLWVETEVNQGSPPNPDGRVAVIAEEWYRQNLAFSGIVEKWGPNGHELKWNLANSSGIGYAVFVREVTEGIINVWSVGPNYLTGSTPAYLRKLEDLGDDVDAVGSNAGQLAATAGQVEFDYQFLRIDVDENGSVYVPFHDPDASIAGAPYSVLINNFALNEGLRYHVLSADQQGYAVAHDPRIPEYEDDAVDYAEFLYLGTRWEAANTEDTQHKLRVVSRTLDAGASPRSQVDIGVANGDIVRFDTGSPVIPTGGASALAVDSPWTHALFFYGEVFFFDGVSYKVFSRKADKETGALKDEVTDWESMTAGAIPEGAHLGMIWNGRVALAGFEKDPHLYVMSAKDNARDWDLSPPIALSTQAISGPLAPAGTVPGIITSMVPWSEDTAVLGCDHQIFLFRGDPMAGGRIDLVTDSMGFAFGRHNWTLSPRNVLYFINDDGQFCRWRMGELPMPISEGRVDDAFRAIDLSVYMPWLVYDRRLRGVWVFLVPYATTHSVVVQQYFFCEDVNGWQTAYGPQGPQVTPSPGSFWPITFGTASIQPVSAYYRDGDAPGDRVLIVGTSGGQVLELSGIYDDDDGTNIDSRVVLGPIVGQGAPWYSDFTDYEVTLADELGGARLSVHCYDRPLETLYEAEDGWDLESGVNDHIFEPMRGALCYMEIRSHERMAIESIACDMTPGSGIKRRERE